MSAILKGDFVMTSTLNVSNTELRDLYNQRIDNTCSYSFLIYPTGWIRVYKIRFVSMGENREKPCPVCKNKAIFAIKLSLLANIKISSFLRILCQFPFILVKLYFCDF